MANAVSVIVPLFKSLSKSGSEGLLLMYRGVGDGTVEGSVMV